MKILKNVGTVCKNVASKAKNQSLALVAGAMAMGASSANAAGITLTEGTGFSGTIDSVYYLTAAGIVVSFLGIALAVTMGIRALKKA